MQIRNKLTLRFATLAGSILLAFSILIYALSANYRKHEFNQRLKERAVNTAKLLIDVKEIDNELLRIIDSTNYSATLIGSEVVVIDYFKKSKVYASIDSSSINIDEELLTKIRNEREFSFRQGGREALGFLYSNDFRRFIVISSAIDIYGMTKMKNLFWILTIGYLGSIIAIILVGRYFSKQALKPIINVISEVSSISASNLSRRVNEGNGNDEIAHLAITFNKMLDRIETAFKMQRSFVSNASHELRTPLASITSQIEVVLLKSRKETEYKDVLQSVLEDARGLTNLTNNLLEIARSEQDISTMKIEKIRLDELLLETQSELLLLHPSRNLEVEIEDNTDDDHSDLSITGNQNLIKLIFMNLIDNGWKFSENKPVKVTIEFRSKDVRICFEDHGIGIPVEEIPHIFEPFYRAQNAQSKRGHGIGLSLISKIITLHSGKIDISSKIGEGTTIDVFLPYKL
ncbi:MAG TPA: HAMP domain-containing sensor histidine kinase [Lentimicrobium sp.]|nr:HAMP domain-containing sensor histidine kinase [Lentimicrobium sp.]